MTKPQTSQVTVRRAPKIGVFLVFGGFVGMMVTLVLTSLFPADPNVGFIALFAYFSLFGIPAGVVLGALLALLLDRVSRRRAKTVDAVRVTESGEAANTPGQ